MFIEISYKDMNLKAALEKVRKIIDLITKQKIVRTKLKEIVHKRTNDFMTHFRLQLNVEK